MSQKMKNAAAVVFFPILGGARAPGAPPPPGSAPDNQLPKDIQTKLSCQSWFMNMPNITR